MTPNELMNQRKTIQDTHDGLEVRTNGQGLTAVERRVNTLEKVSQGDFGRVYMLIYDIPSPPAPGLADTPHGKRMKQVADACPNPSWTLWRFGFRLNLSCWVLPEKSLNAVTVQRLLAHWRQFPEVETHVIEYHPDAVAQIKAIASKKLMEEAGKLCESLMERTLASKMQWDKLEAEAKTFQQSERAKVLFGQQVKDILREVMKHHNILLECVQLWEDDGQCRTALAGLKQAARGEEVWYNAQAALNKMKEIDVVR
jgi:hypothetical protein